MNNAKPVVAHRPGRRLAGPAAVLFFISAGVGVYYVGLFVSEEPNPGGWTIPEEAPWLSFVMRSSDTLQVAASVALAAAAFGYARAARRPGPLSEATFVRASQRLWWTLAAAAAAAFISFGAEFVYMAAIL